MSSKILSKIHKQMENRNMIRGIELLSKKDGLDNKYIKMLKQVIESYYIDDINSDYMVTGKMDEEYYYEQIYIDMKRKNIIYAIKLLSDFQPLDRKYLDIIKDMINSTNEKGYTI